MIHAIEKYFEEHMSWNSQKIFRTSLKQNLINDTYFLRAFKFSALFCDLNFKDVLYINDHNLNTLSAKSFPR